jgi:peptide deformylase
MALLKVARLGHPILRQQARAIPLDQVDDPALQRLIDDMITTMQDDNGIGLAAPQVHQSLQLAVLGNPDAGGGDPDAEEDDPDTVPLTVLINPQWLERSARTDESWEGCLSIPGLRGVVSRSQQVVLRAVNREGITVELEAEGFFARVLQHEIDHLEGVVYLDRMADMRRLAFMEEFGRYWVPPEDPPEDHLEGQPADPDQE